MFADVPLCECVFDSVSVSDSHESSHAASLYINDIFILFSWRSALCGSECSCFVKKHLLLLLPLCVADNGTGPPRSAAAAWTHTLFHPSSTRSLKHTHSACAVKLYEPVLGKNSPSDSAVTHPWAESGRAGRYFQKGCSVLAPFNEEHHCSLNPLHWATLGVSGNQAIANKQYVPRRLNGRRLACLLRPDFLSFFLTPFPREFSIRNVAKIQWRGFLRPFTGEGVLRRRPGVSFFAFRRLFCL